MPKRGGGRFVKTGIGKNVNSALPVTSNMPVEFVREISHSPSVSIQGPARARARSSLSLEFFKQHLSDHPDVEFVEFILHGIKNGVKMGYYGPPIIFYLP